MVTPQNWCLADVFGGSDNGATKQKYDCFVAGRGVKAEDRVQGDLCERKAPNRN